ncbi:MAG TPA: oligosaccharide flippase family protein [Terracidiphilus sp.]|nr:oligosaccharide flippase family protein [Terracidiphilus sp.]
MSNTKTIARNTGWYGLESGISFIVTLFTSIAIARYLGPTKMGYMIYVMWIAQIVSSLGGMGIPATTRKYMAEFLGMGDSGTARYIYMRTLLMQAGVATVATAGILLWIFHDAQPGYLLASSLIALSIWPSMVNSISAQANVAAEQLSANLPGSVASIVVFFLAIMGTVVFHWGVIGVGASMLAMRSVDFLVRFFPTFRRTHSWSTEHVYPEGLGVRMLTFAWQSVASMVLALIVWDRSEFFLLKHLCADIRQLAFYSVAFSMADRLLVSASIFGQASSATIFAQYGRDKSRLPALVSTSFRYLTLTSIPLHAIASALAVPALLLLYGDKYSGAEAVVTIAPMLCLPKAFLSPAQSLLQSAERQVWVIGATIFAGIVDIGVAWYLIPAHGAVGACIGSGIAQIMAVGTMWAVCIALFQVRLDWAHLLKVCFISALASLTAFAVVARFSPIWAILLGGTSSLAVFFTLLYLLRVFEPQDRDRFVMLTSALPASVAGPLDSFLSLVAHVPSAKSNPRRPLPGIVSGGDSE